MRRLLSCGLGAMLLSVSVLNAADDVDALRNGVVKITSASLHGKVRTGTGFIVKLEAEVAFIVTAYHVVEGDKRPQVEFYPSPDAPVSGEVRGTDSPLDAALVVVRGRGNLPQGIRALRLKPGQRLRVGQDVTTIGFPAGLGPWAVTKSNIASQLGSQFVLSGAIDDGSSGSPVLQEDAVLGMVIAAERNSGRVVPAQSLDLALQGWRVDLATGLPSSPQAPTTLTTPAVPPMTPTPATGAPKLPPVQETLRTPAVPPATSMTAATAPGTFKAGETFKDCSDCPEMVVVPAGRFTMGSPKKEPGRNIAEGPPHEVAIARVFAVGKHEVTRAQFAQFVREAKRDVSGGCLVWDEKESNIKFETAKSWRDPGFAQGDEHPVVCVDHEDATAYVQWLAAKSGKPYRLLSESEWEYAARAGSTASRFWGEAESPACTFANVADRTAKRKHPGFKGPMFDCEDGYAETAPVGRFKPNGFGLHDTLGNVWEWVEDCYHDSYRDAPTDGSPWLSGACKYRVIRGGNWLYEPRDVRSASRDRTTPVDRRNGLGFRVARTLS